MCLNTRVIPNISNKIGRSEEVKRLPVETRRALDDLHIETSTYGSHHCTHCHNCSWREFQKCLPNFSNIHAVHYAARSQKSPNGLLPTFRNQISVRTTKQERNFHSFIPWFCRTSENSDKCVHHKMVRFVAKLLLALVFVLCVVLVMGSSYKTNIMDGMQVHGPVDPIEKELRFKSVSKEEFYRFVSTSRSNWDVLRMFLKNGDISDEELRVQLKMRTGRLLVKKNYDDEEELDDYDDDDYFKDQSQDNVINSDRALQSYYDLNENWACSVPKPEIEKVSYHGQAHRVYFPKFTVVHRCRNVTGCCFESDKECQPNRVQIIEQPFLVFAQHGDNFSLEENIVEMIAFVNHTECACKHIPRLPRCHCPHPFKVRMENAECQCVCHENDLECQRARCGVDSLSPVGRQCVQEGRCTIPACYSGDYDAEKGACTHNQQCENQTRLRLRPLILNGGR